MAPFLVGTPPSASGRHAAAPGPRGEKGAEGPPSRPPPPPGAEQAMIALLQHQIASFQGVINTLRCELAESRGESTPVIEGNRAPRAAAVGRMCEVAALAQPTAATTRTAPGRDPRAADRVVEA